MANRTIKGVLSRNSWDFYEYSCAYAFTLMTWFQSGSCAMLINPGTQQANLDVYRAELYASQPFTFYWFASPVTTPIPNSSGSPNVIQACETNQPQPMGMVGSFNATWFTIQSIIRFRCDTTSSDSIEVQSGGPFVTLAPNWALGVIGLQVPGPGPQVAVNFWYQVIADQISQVR